jgi:hypothetical protein
MKSFKFVFVFSVIAVFFCSLFFACGDDSVSPANLYISDSLNILWTDEFGNVLGGDTTDWCLNHFGPAYPNPNFSKGTVNIQFSFTSVDTVSLYTPRFGMDTVFFLKNQSLLPGTYQIQINANELGIGIKRVFISYKHNNVFNNYCKNYGDIWVKQ